MFLALNFNAVGSFRFITCTFSCMAASGSVFSLLGRSSAFVCTPDTMAGEPQRIVSKKFPSSPHPSFPNPATRPPLVLPFLFLALASPFRDALVSYLQALGSALRAALLPFPSR